MTSGASPSILGLQRSRKPLPPLAVPAGAALVVAPVEPVSDETSHNVPAITVDPASVYAPTQIPQHAYWEQPSLRHPPQPGLYHPYVSVPPYPRGDGPPTHRQFQSHNPYYSHTASPFPQNTGLAPTLHPHGRSQSPGTLYMMPQQLEGGQSPFVRLQSPSGPYMAPQHLEGRQPRSNGEFPESDMASDWVHLGKGSGNPESRLQTPFLSPPVPLVPPLPPVPLLPPKPVEQTSIGVLSSTELPDPNIPNPGPLTITEDTLPSFYDRQSTLSTQSVHSEHLPAISPPNEAPEPLAPNSRDKTPQSPEQDELDESPVVPAKPTRVVGGRPTTKTLVIIEEGFNKITKIIEGLAEATGKPPSDLYRKLEKSRKGTSEGHLWNIYLHYFARHEEEKAARVNKPLTCTQTFRSQCYAQYKVDNANFHELLETYHELEMAGAEMTVGQRKREVEKYEKRLRDMVSSMTPPCSNTC